MSDLKYLVIFVVTLTLVETVYSEFNHQRHARSVKAQVQQPMYGYGGYPYQSLTPFQSPLPYQPLHGGPVYQPQNYPYNPSYNPYGSGYPYPSPSYPMYPSYPSYPSFPSYPNQHPSYPNQPNFQNYPDPYAHLPTEIIDVNEDGTIDPGFSLEDYLSKFELTSAHHASATGPLNQPLGPITTSNVVTTKPMHATITRTFDSSSSEPKVEFSGSDSQTGSGILIQAADNEDAPTKTDDEETSRENPNEKANEEGENKSEEKGKSSGWFG